MSTEPGDGKADTLVPEAARAPVDVLAGPRADLTSDGIGLMAFVVVYDANVMYPTRPSPWSMEEAVTARIGNIAFDCDNVLQLATFWSAVLGRAVDNGSSEYFASIGGADAERREPAWYFNKVPESKHAKNRVHLDLVDPDPSAVDELVRLGGTVVGKHQIPGQRWTVMQDPEGNEFCIAAKSFTG
ncbi:MAG: hypothetical protein LBV60_25715, partial [Streptomyces sp.]|nr:hypothetical protein [Streptomyces sp.]